jgi:anthranilate synthase component 1
LDHFRDSGTVFHNSFEPTTEALKLEDLLFQQALQPLPFLCVSEETSALSDSQFLELVDHSLENIRRGNVFQLVVSRRFEQAFFGDDFEVYRTLRRLNPSPYLFYLDFEHARLFGSSPETQIALTNGTAEIHPIAGTIRRTGNQMEEKLAIEALLVDEKENAEHTMLVDLARNDLSKYSNDVQVVSYKEVQQFSHVIHLVSKVIAATETDPLSLFNGTFPAGTLSGTPKPKALELLAEYEPQARAFYGGAIGFISSNGNANLAIIIRSALSKNNTLYYQAGAGVVIDSIPENELQEVHNKLGAIRSAIRQTQTALS